MLPGKKLAKSFTVCVVGFYVCLDFFDSALDVLSP
jgi:hypothetical protein